MANYTTIERIAKFLARATSPEENEAKTAIDHAYKRMVRDGITLQDLLTLPESQLFQDTLVRLVDIILANQTDLSPSAKRAAYAEYMRVIVEKFSPPKKEADPKTEKPKGSSREEEARAYRERNNYSAGQQNTEKQEYDKTNSWGNAKKEPLTTPEQVYPEGWLWAVIGFPILFFQLPKIMAQVVFTCLVFGSVVAFFVLLAMAVSTALTGYDPGVPYKYVFFAVTGCFSLVRYRKLVLAKLDS